MLQVGVAPASTPGNLGVFHYLTVLVLTAFGIDRTAAIAYAIVLHGVTVGPKIIVGVIIVTATRSRVLPPTGWEPSAEPFTASSYRPQ